MRARLLSDFGDRSDLRLLGSCPRRAGKPRQRGLRSASLANGVPKHADGRLALIRFRFLLKSLNNFGGPKFDAIGEQKDLKKIK